MRKFTDELCQFKHHKPYHFNLVEYEQLCRRYLGNNSIAKQLNHSASLANKHTPISHPATANKATVLLIHGFMESPYSMLDMAKAFIQQGYGVQTLLLPGHGGMPEELCKIHRTQWLRATEYACDQLALQHKKIIIAGVSMGAALAINAAAHRSDIEALVLISPAFDVKTRGPTYFKIHNLLTWCKLSRTPTTITDFGKYNYANYTALTQALTCIKEIKKVAFNSTINKPIFAAISLQDEVVSAQEVLNYFNYRADLPSKLICYDREKKISADSSIEYQCSRDLSNHILDFSHTSLHIAPSNQLYGRSSDFIDYRNISYPKIIRKHDIYYGSVCSENCKYGILARLRYNPYFEKLMQQCMQYLKDVGL